MGIRNIILGLSLTTVVFTGCSETRKDYLEPQTENTFLKNLGRASIVLSPIGFGTTVLVSEIRRDLQANGIGTDQSAKPAAPEVKRDTRSGEEYYVVERIEMPAAAEEVSAGETAAEVSVAVSQQSYFIMDGDKEYKLNAVR